MDLILRPEHLARIGWEAPIKRELVTRRDIRKFSVASGQRLRKYLDGDEAPPLFHLALFWDIVELDQLSPDGSSSNELAPDIPLQRRLGGGLRIKYHRPIRPGDLLTARRTLVDVHEKPGSNGPIVFFEVMTEVQSESGEAVLTEWNLRLML